MLLCAPKTGDFKDDDLIASLLDMACIDFVRITRLLALVSGQEKVYLAGNFVNNDYVRRIMTREVIYGELLSEKQVLPPLFESCQNKTLRPNHKMHVREITYTTSNDYRYNAPRCRTARFKTSYIIWTFTQAIVTTNLFLYCVTFTYNYSRA